MKSVLKVSITLIIIFGAFGGTLYYLYLQSEEEPIIYATEKPLYTTIIKKTVATGSIIPRQEIIIKPQVSGVVK
jgi:HlyD family secretion protein